MRPTTALHDNVADLNTLLHPGTVFEHPLDVVSHSDLSLSEKRAILASWASDASAIASCPSLRAPDGLKAPVTIDEILEALCALDEGPRNPPGGKPMRLQAGASRNCEGVRALRKGAQLLLLGRQCDTVPRNPLPAGNESWGKPDLKA